MVLVAAVGTLVYWLLVARYYEDTDDAYVGGRVVTITPQTAGTVVAIGADENDTVQAGQMLVRLDPADAHIDLLGREAQLAQAVRETRALYANNDVLAGQRQRCAPPNSNAPSTTCSGATACAPPAPCPRRRSATPN